MRATVVDSEVVDVAVVDVVAVVVDVAAAAAVVAGSVVDNMHLDNLLLVGLDCGSGSGSYQADKKAALYAFWIKRPTNLFRINQMKLLNNSNIYI